MYLKNQFLIIFLIFSLYSCNDGQKENIQLAFEQYNTWRNDLINTEKYFDECPPLTDDFDVGIHFTRYSLPRLEELNHPDYTVIDTTSIDLTKDGKIDFSGTFCFCFFNRQ